MHAILDACDFGRSHQPRQRLIHWLAAKPEGVVMHRHHRLRAQVKKGLERLFRAGVYGAVAVRKVGPDGQQGDLGLQTSSDLKEAWKVGSVAGVIETR